MKLLLRNGILYDKTSGIKGEKKDIFIENGYIREIKEIIELNEIDKLECKEIDINGLFVFPGFIDIHTHFRHPGQNEKEDITSGSFAALHGGYTTCVAMPNTNPPIENEQQFKEINLLSSYIDIIPASCITKGREGKQLVDFEKNVKAGFIIFTDDGSEVKNPEILYNALILAKKFDCIIMEHSIANEFFEKGVINFGKISKQLNLKGIPDAAETTIVFRDIELARLANYKIHLTHLSTAKSIELLLAAKEEGLNITFDVTPHHILLNENSCITKDAIYKVSPPLRSEENQNMVRKYFIEGKIEIIATDHAPHLEKEKHLDINLAPFGITGLETSFLLLYNEFVLKNLIKLEDLVSFFTINPANLLKLSKKGRLSKNFIADITIFNPHTYQTITPNFFFSRAKYSPFMNKKLNGSISRVIKNGQIVYDEEGKLNKFFRKPLLKD
ncbi:MAG: dihydroorotase [Exilispira sp.]